MESRSYSRVSRTWFFGPLMGSLLAGTSLGYEGMAKRTTLAVDMILRMAAEGHAHRVIARVLVETGYTTPKGSQWTHKQVGRVCERHQRRLARATEKADAERLERERRAALPKVDFFRSIRSVGIGAEYDDDNVPHVVDAPFTGTDEEWARMQAEAGKALAEYKEQRREYDARPKDWAALERFHHWQEGYKALRFGKLNNQVGADTWKEGILPLVVDHTARTGEDVMRLLDSITDQPEVKRSLRMLWFGVLEELAMTRETVLALREEVKRLSENADPAR
jgi:hypothetical protein